MKTVYQAVLLIAIVCASALGLLLLLPFVKEGSSWGDIPIFGTVIGTALFLGFVWWLAVGRSIPRALIGWAILLLPLTAHSWIVTSLMLARFEGQRLAKTIQIENYQERDIVWPGFDGPIGLQVTFELHHSTGITALILPPEVRMGPTLVIPRDKLSASLTNGSGYLKNTYLQNRVGDLTLLKPVLFQRVFVNPAANDQNYKWTSSLRFSASDRTTITYFLLPGTVDYIPTQRRICLNSRSYGVVLCSKGQKPDTGCASPNYGRITDPIYFKGNELSAIWLAAGAYDMIADLSDHLTVTMRKHSKLQANSADWHAIQKRLEPDGLATAGYKVCPPGEDSHTSFRTCYCRAR